MLSPFRFLSRVFPILLDAVFSVAADAPKTWSDEAFAPVTSARVATLPEKERPIWTAYLTRSDALAAALPKREKPDFSPLQPLKTPPAGGAHSRGLVLNGPVSSFASHDAQVIADRIVAAQSPSGGWRKGVDYTREPAAASEEKPDVWSGGTLDNDATTTELRVLALTRTASGQAAGAPTWEKAFLRGIEYLLAAQYPNGGFPQVYPLVGGYHDAITYNDDAMVQALELLRDIAVQKPEFAFVPSELRSRCGPAVERGVTCILKSQLRNQQGQRTVWCQQHDALTLQPCAARNFEPIASCTNESASLVKFLMSLPKPSSEIIEAVKGAIGWFDKTTIVGVTWAREGRAHHLVKGTGTERLWARLYEISTDRPVFGDRDRTIHFAVEEISAERRDGYAWYGNWPLSALEMYSRWPARKS